MGQFAPIISVISTVLGTAMSFKSQSEASSFQKSEARQAARDAEIDARNLSKTNEAEARNLAKLQSREESFNRAKAFASGVQVDEEEGSFGLTMKEERATNREQLSNLRETGASQVDATRRRGQTAKRVGMQQAKTTKAGAVGTLISGAKDIYSTGEAADWKLWG